MGGTQKNVLRFRFTIDTRVHKKKTRHLSWNIAVGAKKKNYFYYYFESDDND